MQMPTYTKEEVRKLLDSGIIDTSEIIVRCVSSPIQTLNIDADANKVRYGLFGESAEELDEGFQYVEYLIYLWDDNSASKIQVGELNVIIYRLVNLLFNREEFLWRLDCENFDLFKSADLFLDSEMFEDFQDEFYELIKNDPHDAGDVVYIDRLYIYEPFRGCGIGKTLVNNLTQILRKGCEADPWFYLTMPSPDDKTKEMKKIQIHNIIINGFEKIGKFEGISYFGKAEKI